MIIVYVETTGLDPLKHSLVSIGAIDFEDPLKRFYEECRIWNGALVSEEALNVNGLTTEDLYDDKKKSEKDIILNFRDWLCERQDFTIAGQNVHVDLGFLKAALSRAGEKDSLSYRVIDQHSIVYYHMLTRGLKPPEKEGKSALNSDTIMRYVGLEPEPKPHLAINGAIWEYEALYRLIHNKPGLKEFRAHPIPWLK